MPPGLDRGRRALGTLGEDRAAAWYEAAGYQIVARNWRCREGELDLIARKGQIVVFCEVKTRSSTAFGSPAEAVTPSKQARIRRLAVQWLRETRASGSRLGPVDLRFDVAAVLGARVTVIEEAF